MSILSLIIGLVFCSKFFRVSRFFSFLGCFCGSLFSLELLWCGGDLVNTGPVVDHVIKVLFGIDFIPGLALITDLAHFYEKLAELFT